MRLFARMLPRMNWENDMNIGGVETVEWERERQSSMYVPEFWMSKCNRWDLVFPTISFSLSSHLMLRMSFSVPVQELSNLLRVTPEVRWREEFSTFVSSFFIFLHNTCWVTWRKQSMNTKSFNQSCPSYSVFRLSFSIFCHFSFM